MSVTSQRIEHTPLTGSGLSIPEANKQREFAKWVEAKEVRTTAFTDWMTRRKSPYTQIDIETGQSYAPFISTTVGTQIGASDEVVTFASTALLRVGDQLEIKQFYTDSTTEYDDTKTEVSTILVVVDGTQVRLDRHEGAVPDGSYTVHPVGSVVTVKSRAVNYNDPFSDAITFRGDSMIQHPQRWESGEVPYDLAAVNTADYEAPNGHYAKDVMYWKNELPNMRNWSFINGRKRTGDYLATPKIPYRLGGAIWWAEQVSTNVETIGGLLNIFDFSDIFEDLEVNHADGAGDAIWMAPRMKSIWSEMLLPYKGMLDGTDSNLNMETNVRSAFGSVTQNGIKWDKAWPASKILITSKADWEWGNFENMDWTYVERGPKELGAFQQSWVMGGDFSMVNLNITHQRLLEDIDTRKNLYPARTNFL